MSIWGRYLVDRSTNQLPLSLLPTERRPRPANVARISGTIVNAAYSPYPLVPGGGERFILATTRALNRLGRAAFVTPDPYSFLRLENVMFDLDLSPADIETAAVEELRGQQLERAVVMGNELYPALSLHAHRSFFHCQFPFPLSEQSKVGLNPGLRRLAEYEKVIVNSQFTKQAYEYELARLGRSATVEVVNPPVSTARLRTMQNVRRPVILSIGRFSSAGHAKRQDVLIEAMKSTSREFRRNWTLVLCGTVPNNSEDRLHFRKLQESVGTEIRVEFVLSPTRAVLDELLGEAKIYAHACGFGVRDHEDFARCEHFGITLVEALVAGCQVVCYEVGGGPEIIARVGAGETFGSIEELGSRFETLAEQRIDEDVRGRAAEYFDDSAFYARMIAAVH